MKNDKKTIILYVGSYLCALVSVFFYGFVGFPNNTSGGPGLFDFESTPGNVILFEIIPLLIALALSFTSTNFASSCSVNAGRSSIVLLKKYNIS